MSDTPAKYPNREQFFAYRLCRLLTKTCAAQTIGPESCWLVAVVAHQEDAIHYSRGVTFYNEQLMPLCGFGGKDRLVRARNRAVEAGWLHYEHGGKRKPGIYWTLIPDHAACLDDSPVEEGNSFSVPKQDGNRDGKQDGKQGSSNKTGRQPDGNQDDNRAPSIPVPVPVPKSKANGVKRFRWKRNRISVEELDSLQAGLTRFQEAVQKGRLQENDRLRFLTLWTYAGRQSKRRGDGALENPGAYITASIRDGKWSGADADEAAARAFEKTLDVDDGDGPDVAVQVAEQFRPTIRMTDEGAE